MSRYFLDADAQARYTQDQFEAIKSIGELAKDEKVDFVIVCGDVFENNMVERKTILRTLEALSHVPVKVYLLPGNHDPLDSSSVFSRPDFIKNKPDNVFVLLTDSPFTVNLSVELIPGLWTSKRPYCDPLVKACSNLEKKEGTIRIAVGHGAVDIFSSQRSDPGIIKTDILRIMIESGQIDFVALGDRHSTTKVTDRIWYSGSPLSTDFDETNSGNVLVVDLDTDRCMVEEHKIGSWGFVEKKFIMTGDEGIEQVEQYLVGVPGKDRIILKLGLKGSLSIEGKTRIDSLVEGQRELFAAIEMWKQETDISIEPSEEDLRCLNLNGFPKLTLEKLIVESKQVSPRAETAKDAIALLYRLSKGVSE